MSQTTRRVTSVRQLELLVNFMGTHKQLALGRLAGKEYSATAQRLWLQVTDILNAEGPARTWKEWSKVWSEAKKKLFDERAGISGTGGGPNAAVTLTPVQEQIAEIVGRDVGPISGAQVPGQVPMSPNVGTRDSNEDSPNVSTRDNNEDIALADQDDLSLPNNADHEYAVPHAEVEIEYIDSDQATTSAMTANTSAQPAIVEPPGSRDNSPLVIRRRPRHRASPARRPRPSPYTGNPEGNRSALTSVQETLARVELLRAETGRKLAEVAELQANAAITYAEAA